jgi:hypothetical protein
MSEAISSECPGMHPAPCSRAVQIRTRAEINTD